MKRTQPNPATGLSRRSGFSPIETVGAISVVGMLAVSVVPQMFSVVTNARLNQSAQTYMLAKTAAQRFLDQHRFDRPDTDYTALFRDAETAAHWDSAVLKPAGFLEDDFAVRVAAQSRLAISAPQDAFKAPSGDNNAYSFSGYTPVTQNTTAGGQIVVEAILEQVSLADARALNSRIDGEEQSAGENRAGTDLNGRVKYDFGTAKRGNVRLYVTHR